jgi:hypothetical protein
MVRVNRGHFLRVGAVAAAAGAAGLSRAMPAEATVTDVDGFVYDEGGQVFDVRNNQGASGGAVGNGTTDDTAAIAEAIANAAAVGGTVYVPPGTYLITGPLTISSPGGLVGSGGNPGTAGAATVFKCGSSTAGIVVACPGTYEGFCVDGNATATTPLQIGTLSGGNATTAASHNTFIDVWVKGSAGDGWTIYGSQGSSYHHCGSTGNSQDGLHIDGGAGDLDFWNFSTSGNGRYGVRGATAVTGGTGTYGGHCENVRFFGGAIGASGDSGTSAVYLRGAVGWRLHDASIRGDGLGGPAVDLDQSAGYALDFSRCRIKSHVSGSSPGKACIQVAGTPPGGLPTGIHRQTFLITDGVRFLGGDSSVYFAVGSSAFLYTALDWVCDDTTSKAVSASGQPAADTLLAGRPGIWVNVTSGYGTGTVGYRIDELGHVQLRGTVTGSGGTILTLPAGYRPTPVDSNPMVFLAAPGTTGTGGKTATVSITSAGVVSATVTVGSTVNLDGIRFPVD